MTRGVLPPAAAPLPLRHPPSRLHPRCPRCARGPPRPVPALTCPRPVVRPVPRPGRRRPSALVAAAPRPGSAPASPAPAPGVSRPDRPCARPPVRPMPRAWPGGMPRAWPRRGAVAVACRSGCSDPVPGLRGACGGSPWPARGVPRPPRPPPACRAPGAFHAGAPRAPARAPPGPGPRPRPPSPVPGARAAPPPDAPCARCPLRGLGGVLRRRGAFAGAGGCGGAADRAVRRSPGRRGAVPCLGSMPRVHAPVPAAAAGSGGWVRGLGRRPGRAPGPCVPGPCASRPPSPGRGFAPGRAVRVVGGARGVARGCHLPGAVWSRVPRPGCRLARRRGSGRAPSPSPRASSLRAGPLSPPSPLVPATSPRRSAGCARRRRAGAGGPGMYSSRTRNRWVVRSPLYGYLYHVPCKTPAFARDKPLIWLDTAP